MPPIAPGSQLSHFEILEKLGEGGMGVVYKARDLRLDRLAAIKVLPEKAVAHAEREARFVQEAKAASALNHPNIITVYEIDRVDGVTFIAMEYVDGRTLDQVIPRKGLRFTEALKYAVHISDALAAAHGIGIIHRDLKPANIMITGKGLVKVLDFGLAKLTQPASAESSASDTTVSMAQPISEQGSILGTVAYMSPEQAEGKPVDARSDIFSFGIVLYEMLTGRRPFTGDTNMSTLAAIVNKEPPPASHMVEDLPHDLDHLLARCLRKDPARRFQTMADLHAALNDLEGESESGRLTATRPLKRQPKRAWLWAALAALVVFAIAGVWLVRRFAIAPPAPQRVVPVTTYAGFEGAPSFSPDGNQVAFSWDGEKGDNVDIYVKLLGEPNALRLTNDPAVDVFPAWSPDGKRIAFERYANTRVGGPGTAQSAANIYLISPLGGSERKLADFPSGGLLSWSPDGKWLAVSSDAPRAGIFLLPVGGGEPRRISHFNAPGSHRSPSISPDGHHLAYAICSSDASCDVYIQELDAGYAPQGAARRITQQGIQISGLTWSRDGHSLIYSGSLSGSRLWYLWQVGIKDQRPPQRLEIAGPNALWPSISLAGKRLLFSKWARNADIWRYRVGGGLEPLIVSSLDDNSPDFSPDGNKIVFSSARTGEAVEIWAARADGAEVVQITNRLGRHQGSPRWSPDGRWIAFDSQGQDGHWDVYVMDASGGQPRRITFEPSDENIPNWSRDGKWIYFRSDRTGHHEIWRVPFAGGRSERVTADGGYAARESADAKTLFFLKAGEGPLFAKPTSGGSEQQILPYVSSRAFVPVEDGIYYIGQDSTDRRHPLEFFEFATRTSRLLTWIEGSMDFGLTVSPDRKTILFSKSMTSGADLMMIENFQ